MTDARDLLNQYVQAGSQEAFAELVRRYVDVVYSAARRQARGDVHLAEEITQQVFILFAAKAKTLGDEVLIGGWLYNTACFVARDAIRKEQRRAHHEERAAMANSRETSTAPSSRHSAWSDAEEILDDAMNQLDEPTRGLLVERYFEGKSSGEVAQRLGITEEAARKRLSRAVDQLREMFTRRGVVMSSVALTESLALHAITHAPAHLAASAASAATSSAVAASAATSVGAVQTGVALMAASKGSLIAASIIGAIVLAGAVAGGVKAVRHFSVGSSSPTAGSTTATASSAAVGPHVTGVIRDPAGQPLAGAEVTVVAQGMSMNIYSAPQVPPATTPGMSARARNAANLRAIGQAMVIYASTSTTAADGVFNVSEPQGHYEIVVRSPQGYAQVSGETLAKSTDLRVVPWGRVEGRVMTGTAPVAKIYAFEIPAPYGFTTVMRQTIAQTDNDGRFSFPRIAPGEIRLAQQDSRTNRFYRWAYGVVDPGATLTLNIGGTGQPIVGKFVDPPATQPGARPLVWDYKSRKFTPYALLRSGGAMMAIPPQHQPSETLEEYRALEEAFGKTTPGAQWKLNECGGWEPFVNADGTFRIDDVPSDDYTLEASVIDLQAGPNYSESVATTKYNFTVPGIPTPRSDQAFDVGAIQMQRSHFLHPGDVVTPFDFTTLAGQTRHLSDYRGKHLLLILCGPLDSIQPSVDAFKQLVARFKDDKQLQVVWLMLSTPEEAATWTQKLSLNGDVAQCMNTDVPPEYAPTIVAGILIDPSGRLVQKHLMDTGALEKVLRQAMKR